MSDLISRQAAIDAIKTWGLIDGLAEGQAIEILADEEKLPSAQLELKKGKWIRPFPTRPKTYERFCSECKGKAWYCGTGDYNFCPNCGADMRGEQDG